MNDNQGTIPRQIAHLEGIGTRVQNFQAKPGDETLAKQVDALEWLLKDLLKKVEGLKRQLGSPANWVSLASAGGRSLEPCMS